MLLLLEIWEAGKLVHAVLAHVDFDPAWKRKIGGFCKRDLRRPQYTDFTLIRIALQDSALHVLSIRPVPNPGGSKRGLLSPRRLNVTRRARGSSGEKMDLERVDSSVQDDDDARPLRRRRGPGRPVQRPRACPRLWASSLTT